MIERVWVRGLGAGEVVEGEVRHKMWETEIITYQNEAESEAPHRLQIFGMLPAAAIHPGCLSVHEWRQQANRGELRQRSACPNHIWKSGRSVSVSVSVMRLAPLSAFVWPVGSLRNPTRLVMHTWADAMASLKVWDDRMRGG